ncbi:MAG: hypothetical protein ACFFDM_12260, partial [Candidatus Thorarchaeota archaeon]
PYDMQSIRRFVDLKKVVGERKTRFLCMKLDRLFWIQRPTMFLNDSSNDNPKDHCKHKEPDFREYYKF